MICEAVLPRGGPCGATAVVIHDKVLLCATCALRRQMQGERTR